MPNCWFCYKDAGDKEYHERCSKKFFGTVQAPELELTSGLLKQLAEKTINQRIALTGVQPKLSVSLQKNKEHNRLTIVGLWGEYILKPQHDHYPIMPETEDLTMHIAELFKIPVCEHALLRTTDNHLVYIAKRFDRAKGHKIHVEDLCQVSRFLTENKYKGSYEKTGKVILQYCTDAGLAALTYFELVFFSYLSGNNDMHLKNFSIMHLEDSVTLSPAYDLLNVNLVNPKDEDDLGLTLNGKKRKIKLPDFEQLRNVLGIGEKAFQNTLKKFKSKNPQVHNLIMSSFLPDEMKTRYWNIWLSKQTILG